MNEWNLATCCRRAALRGKGGRKGEYGRCKRTSASRSTIIQLYNYTIILYGGIDRGSELVKGENENEVPCGGVDGGRI